MIRALLCALSFCAGAAPPATAQGADLRERLRALSAPAVPTPAPDEIYAAEIAADLDRIRDHDDALFRDGAAIAVFTAPGCRDCVAAKAALRALAADLGVGVAVHDTGTPEGAALLAALSLDTVPSYVMRDKLIRGPMPAFVLRRYLTGQ
jgi:glutaredoxin